MKTSITFAGLSLLILLIPFALQAQDTAYTMSKENSTMVIKGTSTIHDWEAAVKKLDISVNFDPAVLSQEGPAGPVTSLQVTAAVESIESGKGGMNKKIYEALKEKKHPNIIFTLNSAELTGSGSREGTFTLDLKGTLTIAGTSRTVSFPVEGSKTDNGYRFEGSYSLNMKEYNVDPPSAMFGAIKSGEEVKIEFSILLTPSNNK